MQDYFLSDEGKKLSLSHKEVNVSGFTISVNIWGWISPWLGAVCKVGSFGTTASLFRGNDMDFYIERGRLIMAHNEVCRQAESGDLPLDSSIAESLTLGESIVSTVLSNHGKAEDLKPEEVVEIITALFGYARKLCSFGYIAPLSDWPEEYMTPRIDAIMQAKCPSDRAATRLLLTSPTMEKYSDIARIELCRAVLGDEDLTGWLKKWFWLDFGHIGKVLTKEMLPEKYPQIFLTKEEAEIELKRIQSAAADTAKRQDELFVGLGLDDSEKNVFILAQKFAFLKGYRMEVLSCVNAFFDEVFSCYAKKFGWDKDVFLFSTLDEVCGYLVGGHTDQDVVLKRKNDSIWILDNEEDGLIILQGEDAERFRKNRLLVEVEAMKSDLIKGNTAFPGVVKGKVKIVINASDLNKVEDGDILVAVQTTPELLPGMKKAAAFVTDIGGITSHAAIVSRELKKPCVVGTKNATKVLKDGDTVKVDADHGYILLQES